MIKDHYSITENTLAILPAKHIDYESIVMETNRNVFVRKLPIELIEEACYEDWSTYEGKRKAVIKYTNFMKKTPIPINIPKSLFFFPTHSPRSIFNCWISPSYILYIKSNPEQPKSSIILFEQGIELRLDVSPYILQKQLNRTFECIVKINRLLQVGNF